MKMKVKVITNRLRIYEEPDTKSWPAGTLMKSQKVDILEVKDGWGKLLNGRWIQVTSQNVVFL